jgi:hypothetical protein
VRSYAESRCAVLCDKARGQTSQDELSTFGLVSFWLLGRDVRLLPARLPQGFPRHYTAHLSCKDAN